MLWLRTTTIPDGCGHSSAAGDIPQTKQSQLNVCIRLFYQLPGTPKCFQHDLSLTREAINYSCPVTQHLVNKKNPRSRTTVDATFLTHWCPKKYPHQPRIGIRLLCFSGTQIALTKLADRRLVYHVRLYKQLSWFLPSLIVRTRNSWLKCAKFTS